MAAEVRRGCGYRTVGGMYLVGGVFLAPCDRMPYEVGHCPVCGEGIHMTRGFKEINPQRLFGEHQACEDILQPCTMCQPKDQVAYLMMVGAKYYTPESFLREAMQMGVCKRIPFVPDKLVVGETIVYLTHPKAIVVNSGPSTPGGLFGEENGQYRLLDAEKPEHCMAIFCAFIPQRVEKLVWQSEATPETLASLEKRGITPVLIPDGDPDHAPSRAREH